MEEILFLLDYFTLKSIQFLKEFEKAASKKDKKALAEMIYPLKLDSEDVQKELIKAVLDDDEKIEVWLNGSVDEAKEVIQPLPDDSLDYFPCKPVKANKKLKRNYLGNVPEIQERTYYPELEESQGSLF